MLSSMRLGAASHDRVPLAGPTRNRRSSATPASGRTGTQVHRLVIPPPLPTPAVQRYQAGDFAPQGWGVLDPLRAETQWSKPILS